MHVYHDYFFVIQVWENVENVIIAFHAQDNSSIRQENVNKFLLPHWEVYEVQSRLETKKLYTHGL